MSQTAGTSAPPADQALLDDALALAREAGRRTLRWYRADDLAVDAKGDGTPVTEADRDAESYIRGELAARWPGDAVLGEEEGAAEGTTGRRWVIDPIDGTKAFMRGVPLYSNLVAVEDEHGWAVGVINLPALDECVFAARGLGCWQVDRRGGFGSPRPARVASDRPPTPFLMSSGFTHWDDRALLAVKAAGWALRTWGDAYGYALVATGRADAMVDPSAALWDVAPMPVILAEAGGRFSALDASPGPDAGSGVATNGEGHDDLLGLLRGAPVGGRDVVD